MAQSIFYSKLYYFLELIGSTTATNYKPIDREIVKMAKFLNGYSGIGRTDQWHLKQMKWMNFSDLHRSVISTFLTTITTSLNKKEEKIFSQSYRPIR